MENHKQNKAYVHFETMSSQGLFLSFDQFVGFESHHGPIQHFACFAP